jgi:aspartate carbamoyltransferase regulatory subunit
MDDICKKENLYLTAKDAKKIYEESQPYIFSLIKKQASLKKTRLKLRERYQGIFNQKFGNSSIEITEKNDKFDIDFNVRYENKEFPINVNQLIDLGYKIEFIENFEIYLQISWG